MLVVGSIPSGGKNPLEIIFQGEGPKEAFHVLVDPGDKKITLTIYSFPRARVYPTLGSAWKHHIRPNWGTWRGHHHWPGWAFLTQVTWSLQSRASLFLVSNLHPKDWLRRRRVDGSPKQRAELCPLLPRLQSHWDQKYISDWRRWNWLHRIWWKGWEKFAKLFLQNILSWTKPLHLPTPNLGKMNTSLVISKTVQSNYAY